jgi:hypothetical protein
VESYIRVAIAEAILGGILDICDIRIVQLGWRLTILCTAEPNLNLNPEEKRVYGQLFRQADTANMGVVTGEIAVKFFEKTRLDSRVLGEVSLPLAVETQPHSDCGRLGAR